MSSYLEVMSHDLEHQAQEADLMLMSSENKEDQDALTAKSAELRRDAGELRLAMSEWSEEFADMSQSELILKALEEDHIAVTSDDGQVRAHHRLRAEAMRKAAEGQADREISGVRP